MLKRISFVILFLISTLIFTININGYGLNDLWKNKYGKLSPLDTEFLMIYGNNELDEDLLYKLKYLPSNILDEDIDGIINYQYEILGDNSFKASIYVKYVIENSLGKELIVSVGETIIYDLELEEYASLYASFIFDFSLYTSKPLHIENYKYNANFISKDLEYLIYSFQEETKLDYLKAIDIKESKTTDLNFYTDNALNIEDIYLEIEKKYGYVINYLIFDSNYNPINGRINIGDYYILFLSVDAHNEIYLDRINIHVEESFRKLYCDDIIVDLFHPISDEKILKYYVHFYDNDLIKNYDIESIYKYNANKIGAYEYNVNIIDINDIEYSASGIIRVNDYTNPTLNISNKLTEVDLNYKNIDEIFEFNAYDSYDGDITSKIKIYDLDNYKNNYNKLGSYRFLFKVSDNNDNTVYEIKEFIVMDEKIDIEEENDEEIESEIEDNKDIGLEPKYEIFAENNKYLSREMIKQKLIFSGFYNEDDNLSITSDYFLNMDKNGSYLMYVNSEDGIECYLITVKDQKAKLIEEKIEVDNDYRFLIIMIIIGCGIIGAISYLIIKKVKKN